MPLDLADQEAVFKIAKKVLAEHGKIDILINNGGLSQRSFAVDTSFDVDKRIMNINYFGTVALTKAVLPSMIQHQLGQILTITSVAGKIGVAQRTAYCGSKFALHGFMDALRAEVAQHDINVINISPGFVKTKIAHNALVGAGKANNQADADIENGMTVEYVSSRIMNALRKRREEVYLGKKEVAAIYLMRLFPKLLFTIAKRVAKKLQS